MLCSLDAAKEEEDAAEEDELCKAPSDGRRAVEISETTPFPAK
jgi:hypothetical protein